MDENMHQNEELLADISDLFLRFGLRSTSMDDIANHLKISKKTLYQQFANKDDVVEQVMLYRRRARMGAWNMKELEGLNPVEIAGRIRNFIVSDLGSRLPANHFDMKKYHPAVYQKVAEAEESSTKEFLLKWLEDGIRQKYFREDVDKKLQLYLLGKQFHFLKDPNIVGQIEYPLSVIITTIFTNFVYAISTEKGIKEYERLKNETKQMKDL